MDIMANNPTLLSMAEFKGRVLEALDNIKGEFKLNRTQHELFFKRIRKLELKPSFSINPVGWLLSIIGLKK